MTAAAGQSAQTSSARLIAGAMSGTSADGIDIALTRITGRGLAMACELVHHHHRPYAPDLRREIFAFRGGSAPVNLARLARLGRDISLSYAAAVNEALSAANLSARALAAVAAHGQTLYHAPPDTIQWLDPSLVAAEVGCTVISDFRRADLAAGGQGAPLVPFADYILFRHPTINRVLLNIGGIANITFLPAGADALDRLIAFDTGPGNCLSDHLNGGVDLQGRVAGRGQVDRTILKRLLQTEYFHRPPPKSTDGPEMIALFEKSVKTGELALLSDRLATACALTAASIAAGVVRFCPEQIGEVIASGGGTHNETMMRMLRAELGEVPLRRTDEMHLPAEAKEALAFALLGAATLDGFPSNVPSVTGARRAVVLGSITPRP